MAEGSSRLIMKMSDSEDLQSRATDSGGRESVHNHAQIARSLRRSLRNAAVGARLIDNKSAADIGASLGDALIELRRQTGVGARRRRRFGSGEQDHRKGHMISRIWQGWTTTVNADSYEARKVLSHVNERSVRYQTELE